jgi:hypothetical protein
MAVPTYHFVMDDTSGGVIDSSGNGNDGIWASGTASSADYHSTEHPGGSIVASLSTIGADSLQVNAIIIQPTDVGAFFFWHKIRPGFEAADFFGGGGNFHYATDSANSLSLYLTDNAFGPAATWDLTVADPFAWFHIGLIFNADGTCNLWLNGVDQGTGNSAVRVDFFKVEQLFFGADITDSGWMADFYYFPLVPTANAINGLYELGVDQTTAPWRMSGRPLGVNLNLGV